MNTVEATGVGPYRPAEWTARGLCHQEVSVDWFGPPGSPEAVQAAATCFICPVRLSCLSAAQGRDEQWGIWGGEQFQQQEELPDVPSCRNGLHAMTQDNMATRAGKVKCLECERERSRRRKRRAA
jgi:hypothetical protein